VPATMHAAFTPERLGAPTAVTLSVKLDPPSESLPAPLSTLELRFPANLGLATSGLGLAACTPATLLGEGGAGCPANSRMGSGKATVAVAFGPAVISEQVTLGLYAAPSSDGYLHLAVLATGMEPVSAKIVMTAILFPGRLLITIPAVPGLPGGPDVSLVAMTATIGGHLTYYEQEHNHRVAYAPRGIGLPASCPRGGWPFAARLTFFDGGNSHTRSVVACPGRRKA
jgi:hypothetical protein